MNFIFLVGRILFASVFLVRAVAHFSESAMCHAVDAGLPLPALLVPFGGILLLVGGLSVLFGYQARYGAWVLVIFLVPATFAMHKFWQVNDWYSNTMEQLCFWKNLALLGAALMLTHFGSGPHSLDSKK